MKINPSKKQILKQIKLARKHDGLFSGDTYESGIAYALEWVLGLDLDNIKPMSGYKIMLEKRKKNR